MMDNNLIIIARPKNPDNNSKGQRQKIKETEQIANIILCVMWWEFRVRK